MTAQLTLMPKECGCRVGFCRMDILADGFGDAVMAGDVEAIARLREAYKRQSAICVGGWRAVPPKEAAE